MNIILGEYIKKESILHQLDPRTKIIGSFLLILSFLFINTFIGYVITGILAFTLIFLSKIPLKEFLKSLKYLLYHLFFIFYPIKMESYYFNLVNFLSMTVVFFLL